MSGPLLSITYKKYFMRPQLLLLLTGMVFFLTTITPCQAADKWPKNIITGHNLVIKPYNPRLLKYTDSTVETRFTIAVTDPDDDDPIFGVVWATAAVRMDSAKRLARIRWVRVDDMRFAEDTSRDDVRRLTVAIDNNMPRVIGAYDLDSLKAPAVKQQENIEYTAIDTGKKAQVVFCRTRPTVLVLIDGAPRLQWNPQWGVNAVENSPF